LKILSFNTSRNIVEDPEKVRNYVRLPLSPISINANLLYQFFELLYPKFINDQQNILDIIISDIDKKYKILGLYLYKTKKAGIHETVESLPPNLIRIKSLEIEKLDEVFNKVQDALIKEKGFRISSFRLFKKEAIDLINKYCERIEELSHYEFLERFLELIQRVINEDLVLIYPEPKFIKFLKNGLKLLNNIPFQRIFVLIEEILPQFNISLLINGSGIEVIIFLQKKILKSGKSKLIIKFLTPDELGLNLSNSNIKNNLFLIQKELNTENTYYINQNDIISFALDFIELGIPPKKNNILFLLQKALFAYRSFENRWNMVPRPKIYNNLVRFIFRLFGFNFNLKKLSHWAIPDLIFNYIDFYAGLNSRILFIITDQEKNKDRRPSRGIIFKDSCDHIFLLEFVESTLKKISTINKEELFSGANNLISSIKEKVAEKFGTPSSIIVSDKLLLQNIIKNFIVNHSKLSIFPRFKTLKMLKNEKYLSLYPEFPIYTLLKKKRAISFMKLLLPVLIDKFEF
jgi:hypothetical protein